VRAQAATAEIFNVTIPIPTAPIKTMFVTTVPQGRELLITDIDGSYTCAYPDYSSPSGSFVPYGDCYLTDGTKVRFQWVVRAVYDALFPSQNYTVDAVAAHRSWRTGLRFGPGETVYWQADEGHILWGRLTVMGRLSAIP
jgi:hypothetical protein